ncbi:hypothetical protein ACUHMQ_16505 [Chitinimonas sp. PSY-7]|uniref:hypothetical protein n=1 Tax=Chitinimonas sp. PSY-7 TaxID=3459088 RepID=UPI00403FE3FF
MKASRSVAGWIGEGCGVLLVLASLADAVYVLLIAEATKQSVYVGPITVATALIMLAGGLFTVVGGVAVLTAWLRKADDYKRARDRFFLGLVAASSIFIGSSYGVTLRMAVEN